MFPNRVGFAVFGNLKIECLEIFDDQGKLHSYQFKVNGQYLGFSALCDLLRSEYPSIAKLLTALGQNKFLDSVLDWEPSNPEVRDAFYCFIGRVAAIEDEWEDHPSYR